MRNDVVAAGPFVAAQSALAADVVAYKAEAALMQSTVKEMQATIDKAVADKKTAVANCKCQPSMLTEQHLKIATCAAFRDGSRSDPMLMLCCRRESDGRVSLKSPQTMPSSTVNCFVHLCPTIYFSDPPQSVSSPV